MGLLIVFGIGWVLSHVFEGRTGEYRASQKAHRKKALKDLKRKHPTWDRERRERSLKNSARRNAGGHLAYQFRHGWFPAWLDFADGWRSAREGHEEWRERRGGGEGPRNPFWAGWRGGKSRKEAERGDDGSGPDDDPPPTPERVPDPEPSTPRPTPPPAPWAPTPSPAPTTPAPAAATGERPDAEVIPIRSSGTPGATNGGTPMEAPSLDAAKAAVGGVGQWASTQANGLEQVAADAMAGGLGADGESMKHLANMQEALASVAGFAASFVASTGKHAGGTEYADTGHAAKTDYVKSS